MPSCAGFREPRKSKLGPLKSTFNAENLICSFSMSILIDFGAIRFWNVSQSEIARKNQLKTPYFSIQGHPRSLNLAARQREPVYDFLLVINSNLGPISYCYWDTATYSLKIEKFFTLTHLAPLFEILFSFAPSNLWKSFTVPETRVFQAAEGKDLVILACSVFDWSTCVTDRRTDRIATAKTR